MKSCIVNFINRNIISFFLICFSFGSLVLVSCTKSQIKNEKITETTGQEKLPSVNEGASTVEKSTQVVTLLSGGDVLLESSWMPPFAPAEEIFSKIQTPISDSDYFFINLEEPITLSTSITPFKNPKSIAAGRDFVLKTSNMKLGSIFKESGVDIVNLANNHMGDYGPDAVLDTLNVLKKENLLTTGGGKNLSEASQIIQLEKNGIKLALLGYTDVCPGGFQATKNRPGITSSKDSALLIQSIKEASKWADHVVVMMHWGENAFSSATIRQMELGREIIDAGGDIIIGMHSHFLQPVEYYLDKPIFYSLGNLAFPSRRLLAKQSFLVKMNFNKDKLLNVDLIPIWISPEGQPGIATSEKAVEIVSYMNQISTEFNAYIKESDEPLDKPEVIYRLRQRDLPSINP